MHADAPAVVPTSLRVEASSSCQLRCPECPTTQGRVHAGVVGRGFMTAEDFRALLDLNPALASVELSNWGEAFLNPELVGILAAAHTHRVAVTLGNGVNLNHATPEALEAVVVYGVREITVSLDGATQEVYATYRVRGDLARVLANVRTINDLKRLHRSETPHLNWQFVIFGHNEHEIAEARRLAAEHGMTFSPKLNWSPAYSPPRDGDGVKAAAAVSAATLEEHRARSGTEYMPACLQLWDEPQVNWDGKILGCCVNTWGEFGGNAFTEPIARWSDGEKIRHARAMLSGLASARDGIPCTTCDVFERMRESGAWMDPTAVGVRRAVRTGDRLALARALRERLRARRTQ